jgi:peptidoglycan hydrolase-like protein with peptidoglycan-binding domain
VVEAMADSEDAQFQAMVAFIDGNRLAKYLQQGDWAKFAYHYNGSDFQKNYYDQKLAKAHARFSVGPMPDLRVRAAQLYLTFLGYKPGGVDGWFGAGTQNALMRFQEARELPVSGLLDDQSFAALEAA